MKRTIIVFAFLAIFSVAGNAQVPVSGVRVTFSESIDARGRESANITFTGLESPIYGFYEYAVQATSEAACHATTDFSTARRVNTTASIAYDPNTGSHIVNWTPARDKRDSCRVLASDSSISSGDFAIWRSNFGQSTPLADDGLSLIDGSVRSVRYSIAVNPWSGSSPGLRVTDPGRDAELIEAWFQAAPDRTFLLSEAFFPSETDDECFSNDDFSSAVPIGSERGNVSYNPATASWYLRNSNSPGSPQTCRATLVGDGVVNAADYVVWRKNGGSSAGLKSGPADVDVIRRTTTRVSYFLVPSDPSN